MQDGRYRNFEKPKLTLELRCILYEILLLLALQVQ